MRKAFLWLFEGVVCYQLEPQVKPSFDCIEYAYSGEFDASVLVGKTIKAGKLVDCSNDEKVAAKYQKDLQAVVEDRVRAYGSVGGQLDEIYHDVNAWRDRIEKVKADNPKPEAVK